MPLSRRGFLSGLTSMLAAPAIVHAGNLMPVKVVPMWTITPDGGYLYPFEMSDVIAWIDRMLRDDARRAFDIEAFHHFTAR